MSGGGGFCPVTIYMLHIIIRNYVYINVRMCSLSRVITPIFHTLYILGLPPGVQYLT